MLSLGVAAVTAVLATLLGTPVAVALARHRFPGRTLLNAFFMSPLILPTVVIGIALLQFYNRIGLGASRRQPDPRARHHHHALRHPPGRRQPDRARPDRRARRPQPRRAAAPGVPGGDAAADPPGIMAGAVFAFITSFDNVTISIFLATPRMVTLPVRIYNLWDQPIYPWLVAICALVILWTVLLIAVVERAVSVRGLFGRRSAR